MHTSAKKEDETATGIAEVCTKHGKHAHFGRGKEGGRLRSGRIERIGPEEKYGGKWMER